MLPGKTERETVEGKEGPRMWKLLFLARRGWKMIPREHRRRVRKEALKQARKHGPTVAKAARTAVKQARQLRNARG
jgi:hypothetical protein